MLIMLDDPPKTTEAARRACVTCLSGWTRRLPVPGFPGIYADDAGGIWSDRSGELMRRTPQKHSRNDYYQVQVKIDGRATIRLAHRWIGDAFLGPLPHGMQTRHLDGDGRHNCLTNLRYGTKQENEEDRCVHGTIPRGSDHPRAVLTEASVREARSLRNSGATYVELAQRYGVTKTAVRCAVIGKTWAHV